MKIRLSKHGVHFFNRNSGLNILLDEVAVPEPLWNVAPRHVSFALTNACDLSCSYCYAPKIRSELNVKFVKKWLQELDQNGTIGVGFGGGEPTIYKHFADLCIFSTYHTNMAVSFTSHGHHLSDELLSKLKGNVHFARISVDGIGKTYERLRGRSFLGLQHRLAKLRGITSFGINYVVNEDTIKEIDEAIDFAISVDACELLLLPERPNKYSLGIDSNTWQLLQAWINKYSKNLPLKISDHSIAGIPVCDPFKDEKALLSYAHISAQGILKTSSFVNEGLQIPSSGILNALMQLKAQYNS